MFSGFNIGPIFIGSYAICAVIGIFAAFPLAIHYFKKFTGDDLSMIFVYLFSAIGVFTGMHILYGITNIAYWGKLFEAESFMQFIEFFVAIFGGSVFYGGLIGGLIAGGISVKVQKLPVDIATDCSAPAIAMFHGFARIGCFMGGCCYGVEWEHGITFTDSIVESANGVPRVPIQLYEAAFEFVLFAFLFILLRAGRFKGRLLALYLLIYPVGRFVLEFWRGDDYRGFLLGLSTSQFISVLMFAGSLAFLIIRHFKSKEAKISR